MKRPSFSLPALVLLIAGGLILFAMSVFLHVSSDDDASGGHKYDANSYSTSSIGQAGLYDVLRRLDRPVSRSTGHTLSMIGRRATLVLAEPDTNYVDLDDLERLASVPRLLVVLPKRDGRRDRYNSRHIEKAYTLPLEKSEAVLEIFADDGQLSTQAWPDKWTVNELGIAPTKTGQVRLMTSELMRPVVAVGQDMLVGEIIHNNRKLWILSDPDLMSNFGLVQGDNAAFMVRLIDQLRQWNNQDLSAPIIFDETIHGFTETQGTAVKMLFEFPFVIVTIIIILAIIMMVLAGTGRFGPPRPAAPELDFGKSNLIDNSARLLDFAGYQAITLKRYIRMTIQTTGQALHAPAGLDEARLTAWLDRIGRSRGLPTSAAAILRTADTFKANDPKGLDDLYAGVRAIHRWKGEMLNGSESSLRHAGRDKK